MYNVDVGPDEVSSFYGRECIYTDKKSIGYFSSL